jgi:hypothetical protein
MDGNITIFKTLSKPISMIKIVDENEFTLQFVRDFAAICGRSWSVKVTFEPPITMRIIPSAFYHHTITLKFHPRISSVIPVASVSYGSYVTSVTLPTVYKDIPTQESAEKLIVLLQLLSKIQTSHITHD